jgi:hypothetical protein
MTSPNEPDSNDFIFIHHSGGVDAYKAIDHHVMFAGENPKSLGIYLKDVWKKAEEADPERTGYGPLPLRVYAPGHWYSVERLVAPELGEKLPRRLRKAIWYDSVSNGTKTAKAARGGRIFKHEYRGYFL